MKKENQSSFDNHIYFYRKRAKISQQELANKVGVSRQTITQLEKNRYNPSLLIAYNIAKIFQVGIEDVFIFTNDD
ncbi:helix-turn-helix transcriptional regulator [Enterococcus faecalis]|nr:helix-turn-helix transcriptional regulator [Enterococcus faecalis]